MYYIYPFNPKLLDLTQLQTENNSMILTNSIIHQIDGSDAISILKNC